MGRPPKGSLSVSGSSRLYEVQPALDLASPDAILIARWAARQGVTAPCRAVFFGELDGRESPMAEPKCSIEGCEKPHRYKASGWCGMHYARARKYGTPDAKVREYTAQTGTCRAEGCDRPAQRKECCQAHCVRLFRGEKDALATPISTQTKKTCTLDGCSRTHVARGYCDLHYSRMRHKGDPGAWTFRRRPLVPTSARGRSATPRFALRGVLLGPLPAMARGSRAGP